MSSPEPTPRERKLARDREYQRARYANDPEYRERKLARTDVWRGNNRLRVVQYKALYDSRRALQRALERAESW